MIAGLHPIVYVGIVSFALWCGIWWAVPVVARAVIG